LLVTLPVCHSLWTGDGLPPLLAACLESFVRQGHQVVLHAYRNIAAPPGIEVRDASFTLPLKPVGVHLGHGAMATFSDWFRYELLERIDGIWIDADLVCIRPIEFGQPYLFGYESRAYIGNAVLRLPAGSALLQHLRRQFVSQGFIPPWFGPVRRCRYSVKRLFGAHQDISTLPHGSTGPRALTWYAAVEGVSRYALPIDVFYPLHFLKCDRAFDADFEVASVITPRTLCIHLWHNSLVQCEPHPRSLAGRMLARDFDSLR
jgi:hypothetical protein